MDAEIVGIRQFLVFLHIKAPQIPQFFPKMGRISEIYPLIFFPLSLTMNRIGANAPRLHGFHRFLPRLWELFFALPASRLFANERLQPAR